MTTIERTSEQYSEAINQAMAANSCEKRVAWAATADAAARMTQALVEHEKLKLENRKNDTRI